MSKTQIVFGTDGWRGVMGDDFTIENVKLLSQAVANVLKRKKKSSILIGYDRRRQADEYAKAIASVYAANNIKAYLTDRACPTPVMGWAGKVKGVSLIITLTASHNPPQFQGYKFMAKKTSATAPVTLTDQFLAAYNKLKSGQYQEMDFEEVKKKGQIETFNPEPSYIEQMSKLFDLKAIKNAGLKILFNPMHGAGIGYLPKLISNGKTKITSMNDNIDPTFGGHSPEPIDEKNIADQIAKIKKGKYDIGIAFDGDADRIGLIDERGNQITSQQAFILLMDYLLRVKKKIGPVIKTITSTTMIDRLAKIYNVPVTEVKVGFKYVAEEMIKQKAILGGEESGGYGIPGHVFCRDSCVASLMILSLMVVEKKPVSKILANLAEKLGNLQFEKDGIILPYKRYQVLKKKVTDKLTKNPPKEILGDKIVKTRTDDGVKFYFADGGWLLVRFSGTEPKLRLQAESTSMDRTKKLLAFGKEYVEKFQ